MKAGFDKNGRLLITAESEVENMAFSSWLHTISKREESMPANMMLVGYDRPIDTAGSAESVDYDVTRHKERQRDVIDKIIDAMNRRTRYNQKPNISLIDRISELEAALLGIVSILSPHEWAARKAREALGMD